MDWAPWADWRIADEWLPEEFHNQPKSIDRFCYSAFSSGLLDSVKDDVNDRANVEQILFAIGRILRDMHRAQFSQHDPNDMPDESDVPSYVQHTNVPFERVNLVLCPLCMRIQKQLEVLLKQSENDNVGAAPSKGAVEPAATDMMNDVSRITNL